MTARCRRPPWRGSRGTAFAVRVAACVLGAVQLFGTVAPSVVADGNAADDPCGQPHADGVGGGRGGACRGWAAGWEPLGTCAAGAFHCATVPPHTWPGLAGRAAKTAASQKLARGGGGVPLFYMHERKAAGDLTHCRGKNMPGRQNNKDGDTGLFCNTTATFVVTEYAAMHSALLGRDPRAAVALGIVRSPLPRWESELSNSHASLALPSLRALFTHANASARAWNTGKPIERAGKVPPRSDRTPEEVAEAVDDLRLWMRNGPGWAGHKACALMAGVAPQAAPAARIPRHAKHPKHRVKLNPYGPRAPGWVNPSCFIDNMLTRMLSGDCNRTAPGPNARWLRSHRVQPVPGTNISACPIDFAHAVTAATLRKAKATAASFHVLLPLERIGCDWPRMRQLLAGIGLTMDARYRPPHTHVSSTQLQVLQVPELHAVLAAGNRFDDLLYDFINTTLYFGHFCHPPLIPTHPASPNLNLGE